MNVESLISEGLYLMLIGMGFVICFLTILVFLLYAMEKLVDHEEIVEVKTATNTTNNGTLTAVISAAIYQHRNRRK